MNDILVLTAVTGNRDRLIDPTTKYDNCDYVAFVETDHGCKVWQQKQAFDFSFIDKFKNRRNAKVYKILASILFPQYKYIVWHDANIQLTQDPNKIITDRGEFDLLLFKHPNEIQCAYYEMNGVICNAINWDWEIVDNVISQFQHYRSLSFPNAFGLWEMTAFIRKNTQIVKEFELMWWEQICKFSSRDQTSLPFVLWKLNNKINVKELEGFINSNRYFSKFSEHMNSIGGGGYGQYVMVNNDR